MSRSRTLTIVAVALSGVVLLGACSTESLTERAIERGLEQAVEGNEDFDVDLNFDGDGDGSFSITTDDGEISFDVDADGDGGTIVFESEDGSGAINVDDDGGVVFASDDGTSSFASSADVPESWPAAIGIPASANPDSTFFSTFDTPEGTNVTGAFEHSSDEDFASHAQAALESMGWDVQFESADSDGRYVQLVKNDGYAMVVFDKGGFTSVTITTPA